MMLRGFISFTVVLLLLTEGSSVKVHPGGNTTLPCNIKDDEEITWIIINGNQTFVRILKLEYLKGTESKPESSYIHPSYAGRIKALSSPTNTHSLLLMNITDTDLMLYCCTERKLEQTHCSKLDYGEQQNTEGTENTKAFGNYISTTIWLSVICVFLLLSLMSNVCMCWKIKRAKKGNLRGSQTLYKSKSKGEQNEGDEISYASVNINKVKKHRERNHLTQDTVYASIK
ncbi:uncharacterized protein LOC125261597 isoform X2 [Megalobrama amblycephala]|uniref:uncharacterized protein LOC125261597 isoform X2 n=1 Tax=Megalobrama amblycephala TaxID=75352 RepID=UPI002014264D|nr:uncharacterized protein LOC125261597 isoform X2 [Megalobrama amblycephala]